MPFELRVNSGMRIHAAVNTTGERKDDIYALLQSLKILIAHA